MTRPTLYGMPSSVYVRAVRLALHEKSVAYDLISVDPFVPCGPPAEHLVRHPFGRIPAFEHAGFRLYESSAIQRYIDEAFPGPSLQPLGAQARARMNQAIGVLDSYAYRTLVWDIFVERVRAPERGRAPDATRIAAALPRAATCLHALAAIRGAGPWLAGPALSLADLHAAPMLAYLRMAPEGAALLAACPPLAAWWDRIAARPSMTATHLPPA